MYECPRCGCLYDSYDEADDCAWFDAEDDVEGWY